MQRPEFSDLVQRLVEASISLENMSQDEIAGLFAKAADTIADLRADAEIRLSTFVRRPNGDGAASTEA
ncbi:hypothetical protein SAMN02745157_4448 [Kaistia soli DSM 19436]|uniref:Uncharacterized protein n=2 Tax=Kaistia TaxID=166953 RepID=A0A1M5KZP6_9HYPH|nr:hypothetical protein SAMN02745157_4448 [Kaistia soli DSM 19436]